MLLTSTFYSHMPNQHYATHAPLRSSPLRERSANAAPGLFDFSMSQHNQKQPEQPPRAFKANPIIQTRDAATKRRRDMFFNRVQHNREDKKWEARGEQLQQLDFVSERKRWESKKAREAPPEEDEFDDQLLSNEPDMSEADYVLAQEEYELQQMIAAMEEEKTTLQQTAPMEEDTTLQQVAAMEEEETTPQHYGSDDDDYDQIFMECADVDARYQQPQAQDSGYRDVDDMDMTDG